MGLIVNVKQYLDAGLEGKWVKLSPEECDGVIQSVPAENMRRGGGVGTQLGPTLFDYRQENWVMVHGRGTPVESGEPAEVVHNKAVAVTIAAGFTEAEAEKMVKHFGARHLIDVQPA